MAEKKKDQFVIAYLPDFEHCNIVMSHALSLARMLDKGLILLHISDSRYGSDIAEAEQRLQQLQQQTTALQSISYISLKGDTQLIVEALPTKLNGVVAVAAVDAQAGRKNPYSPKEVLRNFANSKIAYLTVQKPFEKEHYNHIALSIDFHRESKEKLIWSSYFGRFDHSTIHVLYHDYKDEGLRQKWYNNMQFLNKFYSNLGLSFVPSIVEKGKDATDADAIPFSAQKGFDLLVSVTTKEKDMIDNLLGAQESRSIKNKEHLPILFINPRNDIYVLCD